MPLEELVPLLVPRSLVAEVYDLVAGHERDHRATETSAGEADDDPSPAPELDEALVRRMYDESEGPHRQLMKYLASRPDEWVWTSEIAAELQLRSGSRSAAGMLGAFGRRAKHRYGSEKPWEEEWVADRGEMHFRMLAWVAEIINSL